MATPSWTELKAVVVDADGPVLSAAEKTLFAREKPAGFILFQRNCIDPTQVARLVADMRLVVGRPDIPILIDQEGGSVARLRAPAFSEYASARAFGDLYALSAEDGLRAAALSACLMARDLAEMGITVNCAPVADVPAPACHAFLADSRTFSRDESAVAALADAFAGGLLRGGVTPVMKHLPGHGRAQVDSHQGLPVVDAAAADLAAVDFAPFRRMSLSENAKGIWGMVAHVVYNAIDPADPATVSRRAVEMIRDEIGFDGLLIADDISMKALCGEVAEKTRRTLAAGMDLTMICNASLEDRAAALAASSSVSRATAQRLEEAERIRLQSSAIAADDIETMRQELCALLAKTDIAA